MNKKVLGAVTTPAGSTFNRRKSLKATPDVPEDIPLNDDEAEIEQRRRLSGKFGQLAGKRVSLGGIAELSASELVAQYTNCMRLSAENKINHKNAFSLPLIDCMKLLLKKKDEQMNNFQVVGCTLDASAKIYASRVDRVHMDGISFAKGLGSRARDLPTSKNSGSGDDEALEEGAEQAKKKKYRKKHKLSKDTSKINITMDAAEPDPTYVVLSKQFSNCQPSFICFIPRLSVVGDSSKVFMEMKRQFLTKEQEMSTYKEMDVSFDCDADGNGQIVELPFREILARETEDIDYDTLLHASTFDDSLFDVDDRNDNDMNDFCGPEDPIFNDNVAVDKEGISEDARDTSAWKAVSSVVSEDIQAVGCQAKAGPRERVVDLQQAILRKVQEGSNLEYTYLNLDRILFAGPAHWGRLPVARVKEKTCALEGNKKKSDKKVILDFNHMKDVDLPLSRGIILTRAYIENNWSTDKVTNPADLHLDPKTLLRFFNCPKCGVNVTSTQKNREILPEEEEDGDINDYDYDNLNDSQQFCPAPCLEPESDGDTSASKGNCPEGGEPAADIHSFEPSESSDGWSMVDPPNKVARIAVPYAQHAKKVDMKVLKMAIWSALSDHKQNGEIDAGLTPKQKKRLNNNNIKNTNSSQASLMEGQMNFSEMERIVIKKVPTDMAQELTMPLIFTALLHLANERILSLKGLEDHSDIIITQDSGAEKFIHQLQQREFV
ncbi:hypothetical protein R5R35_000641 [Gryllus longicercus]|uniref:Condensin complex subunit 2 n=1 Tax=Gryllus longicercus TaxID=2509291 RepID=A0AAN9VNE9_9ORTH